MVTGNAAITGLSATDGTIDDAKVTSFTVTGADLFVGTGGALDGTRTPVVVGDAGFSVTGAAFTLVTVSSGTTSFTAIEASVTTAALIGVSGVDIEVTGSVKLNSTSAANGERIDWTVATLLANDADYLIPALTLTSAQELQATGGASLDIGSGSVVAVATNVTLDIATMDVITGNVAITGFSATDGTIDDAKVTSFTVTGADLFVGTGGSLDGTRTGVVVGDAGFSVTGAGFTLVTVVSMHNKLHRNRSIGDHRGINWSERSGHRSDGLSEAQQHECRERRTDRLDRGNASGQRRG